MSFRANAAHADGEVGRAPFVGEGGLQFVARTAAGQQFGQAGVHTGQLVDVCQDLHAQQAKDFVVLLADVAPVVQHHDARVHAVQDEFVVLFPLDGLVFRLSQYLRHAVEGTVDEPVGLRQAALAEAHAVVVVADGVQQEEHLAGILAVEADLAAEGVQGEQGERDGCHIYMV